MENELKPDGWNIKGFSPKEYNVAKMHANRGEDSDVFTVGMLIMALDAANEQLAVAGNASRANGKEEKVDDDQRNRIASAIAHRACCGSEHDPLNGKLHGYCVVCGVEWPCDTAKKYL